jgi:CheY-like chemotaxis protein
MDESGLSPGEQHARFLQAKLRRLGIEVELEQAATSGVGVLSLSPSPLPTLEKPFTAHQARFYTLGHCRIKLFEPAPLFALQALNVGDCGSLLELEGEVRRAWAAHIRELHEARRWLKRLGVRVRTDRNAVRLLVHLAGIDGPPALVRSARELLLPSGGPLRDVSVGSPAKRIYHPVHGTEHSTELELGITHELEQRGREKAVPNPTPQDEEPGRLEFPSPDFRQVLIIDDEQEVRRAAEAALAIRGLRVEALPDPRRGLEALRRRSYDVVVLDTRMPRMDGLELTANILDLPGIAELPVLLLDERPNLSSREIAERVGAAGYLAKPTNWGDLAESVLDLIDGWARRRFDRFPLRLKVEIDGAPAPALHLTQTIGRGGVQIRTTQDVVPGSTNVFRIHLPGALGTVRVEGAVVYRLSHPGGTRIELGIRFLRFAEADESRWIGLIESLARKL